MFAGIRLRPDVERRDDRISLTGATAPSLSALRLSGDIARRRMVVTQVYDPLNMPLDWEVCAYGYNMTTARCGKLKSKYSRTTDNNGIVGYFFRVAPNTSGPMVQGGDSGGPVYGSGTAYGIIKGIGGSLYPNDMYFMSIADINVLGVQVKTAP